MGKGDKKSKKGKIFIGSYGNSRKRKSNKPAAKVAVATVAEVVAVAEEKPKAKRTTKKKEVAE
jgi:30S ribosomal protein S31